jgi:transcriptional regulator with XRE-family HTH domain
LREFRLAKGWTQEELAQRSGVAVSTLKLLEARGQGSFQRLIRVAVALGVDGELRDLFSRPDKMPSIEAVKRAGRRRASRRNRKGEADGT